MNALSQPTIFIIDDDPAARESIGMLIGSRNLPVETYGSAEEFLESFDTNRPGCVISDVRMLGISGVELQEQLIKMENRIPVILITAHVDTQITVRAMRNGAITFLEKPCQESDILAAVNEAIALDASWREEDEEQKSLRLNFTNLNDGEREVMQLMMLGKANKGIANRLDVSIRTVEARRHNVFKKLKVDNIPDLVRIAIKLGFADPSITDASESTTS
ncbi:MAG: response regulator transcription factor [Pirellulales bacterium]